LDLLSGLGVAQTDFEKDLEKNIEEDSSNAFMAKFFEDVNSIKQGMNLIKKNIETIDEAAGQALVSINNDQNSSNDELADLVEQTNKEANKIRAKLKDMAKENQTSNKGTSAEQRIRTNMHGTLTRKFLDLMAEYQEVQNQYKNKYKEKITRQFKIANPDATPEEIDEALESGNTQVFANQILDKRHTQAKNALAYVENRHREILKLEESIKELHQLFVDMAILVEQQSEMLDQIEYNVNTSVAHTGKAVKELQLANQYQKKSRKSMCILICILVAILLFLGGGGLIGGLVGTNSASKA